MKLALFLSLGLMSFTLAHADTSFPNDTGTQVMNRGSDCGLLAVNSAYFTQFDTYGHDGKAVIFHVAVRNDNYNKTFIVKNQAESPATTAVFSSDWRSNSVTAIYDHSASNFDLFTIIDQRVGTSSYGVYDLSVVKNGTTFKCSNVVVSVKLE